MAGLSCCSVKIGTKIKMIGWFDLIGALVFFVALSVAYTNLAVSITETEDIVMGRSLLRFYNETRNEEKYENDDSETSVDYVHENIHSKEDAWMKDFKTSLFADGVEIIPENAELLGAKAKSQILNIVGVGVTVVCALVAVHCIASVTLIVAAYTNKRSLTLPWLVVSYLGLIGLVVLGLGFQRGLPILSSQLPIEYFIYFFIACATRLNMILDAHFFLRELSRLKTAGRLMPTLRGDEPLIVSMTLPDHCFEPKK